LRYGPFASESELLGRVMELAGRADQPFWAVRPETSGVAEGWLSLCDIYPADGTIEIGSNWFSPALQRTRASTEAIFLLMQYAMDELKYQRLVWRCNAANQASINAAARYGFVPGGHLAGVCVCQGSPLRCGMALDPGARMAGSPGSHPCVTRRRKFRPARAGPRPADAG
jgi:RimJ/RimL family protein N-acetyltransferase